MYEHHRQPLATRTVYYRRVFINIFYALFIMTISLGIGIIGYHSTAGASWIDSLHNASMILSGMGPVIEITNAGGKIFSSCYAIFSGVVFITNVGIILAPAMHRLFHRLHLQEK